MAKDKKEISPLEKLVEGLRPGAIAKEIKIHDDAREEYTRKNKKYPTIKTEEDLHKLVEDYMIHHHSLTHLGKDGKPGSAPDKHRAFATGVKYLERAFDKIGGYAALYDKMANEEVSVKEVLDAMAAVAKGEHQRDYISSIYMRHIPKAEGEEGFKQRTKMVSEAMKKLGIEGFKSDQYAHKADMFARQYVDKVNDAYNLVGGKAKKKSSK